MDLKRPRKLNLNAPLLSTRRFGYSGVVADTSCTSNSSQGNFALTTASERVPFSWEQAPGKPKDHGDTPRLILPPKEEEEEANDEADADNKNSDVALSNDREDDDEDDNFSDAMDVFSLSEALDIVQKKSEKANNYNNKNKNNNEGLRLKIEESNGYQSPTYMINRFLPDATALAASSSALHFHDFENRICGTCSYYAENSYHNASYSSCSSSQKGYCGLEILFPWRVKHKLCSIKSPVLPCSTNLQKHNSNSNNNNNNRRSSRQKKHHMPWSCTNAKGDV